MKILCRCIRLDTISASISVDGGHGTWTPDGPKSATFLAQSDPGVLCGGSDRLTKVNCVLLMNSCGRIRVTITGVAGHVAASTTAMTAIGDIPRVDSQQIMQGQNTGAGVCESNALAAVIGFAAMEFGVSCGQQVTLSLWIFTEKSPQIEVSWLVEVIG